MQILRRLKRAYVHYVSRKIRRFRIENRVLRPEAKTVTEATRLINTLIEIGRVGSSNYLEIGVEYGYTFANVLSQEKHAVDPNLRFNKRIKPLKWKLHETTSEDFFNSFDKSVKFDVVFLDGLHTSEQTYEDFRNCLPHLKNESIVIIDDTIPCDEFSANPDQEMSYRLRLEAGSPGDGSWHGDVFKVIVALNSINSLELKIATISDLNNPKTVIWVEKNKSWPGQLPKMPEIKSSYADFFAKGHIDKSFNPMAEQEFYNLFTPGKR